MGDQVTAFGVAKHFVGEVVIVVIGHLLAGAIDRVGFV